MTRYQYSFSIEAGLSQAPGSSGTSRLMTAWGTPHLGLISTSTATTSLTGPALGRISTTRAPTDKGTAPGDSPRCPQEYLHRPRIATLYPSFEAFRLFLVPLLPTPGHEPSPRLHKLELRLEPDVSSGRQNPRISRCGSKGNITEYSGFPPSNSIFFLYFCNLPTTRNFCNLATSTTYLPHATSATYLLHATSAMSAISRSTPAVQDFRVFRRLRQRS
ncbi:hypothetical protein L211DRAFT_444647 [Terfezia boudieri ATCC MYA-4762]|uniref:Uncharacterized protein n=1 Tax=Terfezia boudieri ATCC MYA-4762 TaxID=1051890 RepID=A0A3N4LF81_9PEZI|nr:hypothetical protein L211DRAFT_444647 [Terfezia boudieri ATCC MYA-4762]